MKIKILGGIIGGALGYIAGVISAIRAKAVITVHPELANASWKTAFLSGHYRDWIFYHNPNDAIIAACLLGVFGGVLVAWMLEVIVRNEVVGGRN